MSKGTRSLKNKEERFYVKRKETASCDKTAIIIDCDEPPVKLQVFGKMKQQVCHSFVLITPNAHTHFNVIIAKFDDLLRPTKDKSKFLKYIASNLRGHGIDNVDNLKAIEDDDFWFVTFPDLISFLKKQLPKMKYFPIIKANSQGITDLDRWEVLCLIGCMFLGIMPKQAHEEAVTFGELMSFKQIWARNIQQRRQKLMCIIAYFKSFFNNRAIFDEPIRIKRTSNKNKSYLNLDYERSVPLRLMTVLKRQEKQMEDHYGNAIMINPSSRVLGGNVLTGGCSQEDALMLIMPELIVMKLFCEPLQSDEAIVFYGARRYSKVTLKDNQLTFNFTIPKHKKNIDKTSVVVSINAADYTGRSDVQYTDKEIHSEINKAYAGFEGAAFEFDKQLPVCTGRWGCSRSSNGDEDLKILIQWLAASQAYRDIIYLTDSEQKFKEYKILALELSKISTLDLLNLLKEYVRTRAKARRPISILNYLKQYL